MTKPFESGDRVVYTGNHPNFNEPSRRGDVGTVDRINALGNVSVTWDGTDYGAVGHFPENLEKLSHNFRKGDRVKHPFSGAVGTVTNPDGGKGLTGRYVDVEFPGFSQRDGKYYPSNLEAIPVPKPNVTVGATVRLKAGAWSVTGHRAGDLGKVTKYDAPGWDVVINGKTGWYLPGEIEIVTAAPVAQVAPVAAAPEATPEVSQTISEMRKAADGMRTKADELSDAADAAEALADALESLFS